jgi:hypothetical protein
MKPKQPKQPKHKEDKEATMTCCASSHSICPHAKAWLIFSSQIDAHLLFGYSAKVWRLCTLAMDPVEARAMPLAYD